MTIGLQISNPQDELVIGSETPYYRYWGALTAGNVTATSTITAVAIRGDGTYSGILSGWIYDFTLPSATINPIVGAVVTTSKLTDIYGLDRIGGGVWRVYVNCMDRDSRMSFNTMTVQTPDIRVFIPHTNSDIISSGGAGMEVYTAAGTLAYSTSQKPMWIKGSAPCAADSYYTYHDPGQPYTTTGSSEASATSLKSTGFVPSFSNPIVINRAFGKVTRKVWSEGDSALNDVDLGHAGWTILSDGSIGAGTYLYNSTTLTGSDEVSIGVGGYNAIIVNGSVL